MIWNKKLELPQIALLSNNNQLVLFWSKILFPEWQKLDFCV
jgi:hypothetical protein